MSKHQYVQYNTFTTDLFTCCLYQRWCDHNFVFTFYQSHTSSNEHKWQAVQNHSAACASIRSYAGWWTWWHQLKLIICLNKTVYLIQEKYSYWIDQTARNLQKLAYIKHRNSTYLSNIQVQEITLTNSGKLIRMNNTFMLRTFCSVNQHSTPLGSVFF